MVSSLSEFTEPSKLTWILLFPHLIVFIGYKIFLISNDDYIALESELIFGWNNTACPCNHFFGLMLRFCYKFPLFFCIEPE